MSDGTTDQHPDGASTLEQPAGSDEQGSQVEECQAEFIDGSWYGDDCPACREAVARERERERDECEACIAGEWCARHENGVYA